MMSLSKYKSTIETANLDRVQRIIRGPCTDLLRDILNKDIPPSDLSRKVKQWRDNVENNQNKNPLNKSQNDIIFPSPTKQYGGDYSDLDISILYIILRNVSKISPPNKGWGQTPDPADRSVSANIERIRILRNKYQHYVSSFLSHAEFRQEWRNIWDIVVEVERQLGTGTIYQEYVNEIKTCSMDPKQKVSDMKKKIISRIDGDNASNYASDISDFNISSHLVTNYQQLLDLKNNRGDTALHSACVCGDRKLISFLIEKGLNIDARTNDGDSVLHIACLCGNYDACDFLVTRYPQLLDVKNNNGDTVLHSACVSGDSKLISFLLEKGLDVNALTNDGDSALHIACVHENYDACEFLVTSYLQLIGLKNKKGYTTLHSACENGGRHLISFLLEKGLDVNALTSDGASALHIASCYENYDACEFFVTYYPQLIDIKSNDGSTALHSACIKGDKKLISFLVEKGLDITALTNDGDCALHIACCHENFDACKFLVTNYPQLIDFRNNKGDTVLHAACVNGEEQLISFLLGKGLDILH